MRVQTIAWDQIMGNYPFAFGIALAAFESGRKKKLGRKQAKKFNQKIWFQGLPILVTSHYTCLCTILLNAELDVETQALTLFLG